MMILSDLFVAASVGVSVSHTHEEALNILRASLSLGGMQKITRDECDGFQTHFLGFEIEILIDQDEANAATRSMTLTLASDWNTANSDRTVKVDCSALLAHLLSNKTGWPWRAHSCRDESFRYL